MTTTQQELQTRWDDLTSFVSSQIRDKWWQKICDEYGKRPFRGFEHLLIMLRAFDKYKDHLRDRYATAMAIFFKNIIYDPLADDNADKSERVFREFAQETTFDSENYVADLISKSGLSSTGAHLNANQSGEDDAHFLMDFDMAYLAEPFDKFVELERAQRKEYSHFDEEKYAQQRKQVLKAFLVIPNIYATTPLREDLEGRARDNIQREVELLEKGERKY
ncbi:hypothetical protein WR25_13276 [Diploscapter pachys]|uniref:Uncharacterized protein n=1 Tax=Diploscapter pachys TaxID=2018661 RepID=A0A2A2LWK3_9BILA|nr:hypothetical protein WR25_13276 [Diploscapter pachys]